MAFQPAPGMAEMAFIWSYQTKIFQNRVVFFHAGASYVENDLQNLAVVGDAWVHTSYKPLASNAYSYLRTEVRGLTSVNDFLKIVTTNTGPGTVAAAPLPANVTFAVKLASIYTGRAARGRFFVLGMVDSHLNVGNKLTVTTTFRDAWVTALTALKNNALPSGWAMCIASRWLNKVKRPEAYPFSVATITYADNDVDSQRGRLI